MKKVIKFLFLSTILIYSSSYAAIGYYGNHSVTYTSPGLINLGGTGGPNMGTLCNDDGGGDGSNNKVALGNSSTTTDPETGSIPISPSGTMSGTMRCLYYDATPPNGDGAYDLTQLHTTLRKATVTISCTDAGGSSCDSITNDNYVTLVQGWTRLSSNTYQKICEGLDLSNTITISNDASASCGGPITFKDVAGNTRFVIYNIPGTGTVSSDTSSKLMVKGISQSSSNTNASTIKSTAQTSNASVKDNFSKINKLELKNIIQKNVESLLKSSVNRDIQTYSSYTITNINNINPDSADKVIKTAGKTLYYYKDKTITIDGGASHFLNKNITIVIERGKLNILQNIDYQGNGMLGIILIGNNTSGISTVNIDEGITNGAGILYTDGIIQSTYLGNNIYTYTSNINERGLNQLYWKGSFISQNTIGGSIGTPKCPYGSADYKTCSTQDIARKYDLLFFRRYSLINGNVYYGITSAVSPFAITSIPFGTSDRTIYISGKRGYNVTGGNSLVANGTPDGTHQDKNISNSFILDYDSRITGKSAPLGFSSN